MKSIIKSLLAFTALASIGSASAETIYLAGSTAFRSAANTAVKNYCTANGGSITASNNTSFGSATKYVGSFTNGGSTHYISVALSGSEGGIQTAAGPRSGSNAVNNTFWASNATGTNLANLTISKPADLAFSDTYQGTSLFNGAFNGKTYASLEGYDGGDGVVGVVTFCWVASSNCPIANVTSMAAQNVLAGGSAPVALFTGNPSDETKGVYLIGRNSDSGTRLATFGECGFGANSLPQQYKYNTNNSIQLYPAETINGVVAGLGNSGYSSGGTVAGFMVNTLASGASLLVDGSASIYAENYLIGYAGVSDANSYTASGLKKLTYNGFESSTANIANGSYTFWTYIHLYQNPAASAVAKAVSSSIGSTLQSSSTATVTPNVGYNNMRVGRNGDGLSIYANY
jgi:hypothetical protein